MTENLASLAIIVSAVAFAVVLMAFLPDPKDDDDDYNGKDKQP